MWCGFSRPEGPPVPLQRDQVRRPRRPLTRLIRVFIDDVHVRVVDEHRGAEFLVPLTSIACVKIGGG